MIHYFITSNHDCWIIPGSIPSVASGRTKSSSPYNVIVPLVCWVQWRWIARHPDLFWWSIEKFHGTESVTPRLASTNPISNVKKIKWLFNYLFHLPTKTFTKSNFKHVIHYRPKIWCRNKVKVDFLRNQGLRSRCSNITEQ